MEKLKNDELENFELHFFNINNSWHSLFQESKTIAKNKD